MRTKQSSQSPPMLSQTERLLYCHESLISPHQLTPPSHGFHEKKSSRKRTRTTSESPPSPREPGFFHPIPQKKPCRRKMTKKEQHRLAQQKLRDKNKLKKLTLENTFKNTQEFLKKTLTLYQEVLLNHEKIFCSKLTSITLKQLKACIVEEHNDNDEIPYRRRRTINNNYNKQLNDFITYFNTAASIIQSRVRGCTTTDDENMEQELSSTIPTLAEFLAYFTPPSSVSESSSFNFTAIDGEAIPIELSDTFPENDKSSTVVISLAPGASQL